MPLANLLVVDDDPKLRRSLRQGLEESGYACEAVAGVHEAREILGPAGNHDVDLVLLDVMLDETPGWTLLRELREANDRTPVIFVSARHSVEERIQGLELGADDYVVKPFVLRELLARIQAVLRRRRDKELTSGDLVVDLDLRHVNRAGRRIELSPREFELLCVLLQKAGQPCTKSELLHEIWGIDFEPGTNVVEVAVARLRRKIEQEGPTLIHTITGVGYRLGPEEGT